MRCIFLSLHGDQRDLHISIRRQREMCIRDKQMLLLGLSSAAALATLDQNDMGQDLDIPREELSKALWGSHSLRRLRDGVARDYCLEHDSPLDRVDARMGWKEAERLRDMQHHYEEQHLRRRIRSMRLTQDM